MQHRWKNERRILCAQCLDMGLDMNIQLQREKKQGLIHLAIA